MKWFLSALFISFSLQLHIYYIKAYLFYHIQHNNIYSLTMVTVWITFVLSYPASMLPQYLIHGFNEFQRARIADTLSHTKRRKISFGSMEISLKRTEMRLSKINVQWKEVHLLATQCPWHWIVISSWRLGKRFVSLTRAYGKRKKINSAHFFPHFLLKSIKRTDRSE